MVSPRLAFFLLKVSNGNPQLEFLLCDEKWHYYCIHNASNMATISNSTSSKIEDFLITAKYFAKLVGPKLSNVWICVLTNGASLYRKDNFVTCPITLPKLILADLSDNHLEKHIDKFWERLTDKSFERDIAKRLGIANDAGCKLHKHNGNRYMCINFSSLADQNRISEDVGRCVVPPWIKGAVELYKNEWQRFGLPADVESLCSAVCEYLSTHDQFRSDV